MDERLEHLEVKVSYQEHLVQELNDVIVSQQNQMDALEKSVTQLREYIRGMDGQSHNTEPEAPPPHY